MGSLAAPHSHGRKPGHARLAAAYKAGKTSVVGNLTRALADGVPFLDAFAVEPPGAELPGAGGKPGTSGRLGPLDPPTSWPGTCTPMPRPGTPMSIGGVVTGGRTWALAGPTTATVAPTAAAATASARTAARRRITSAPPLARRGPLSTSPPAATRRTSTRARARSRR